LTDNGPGFLSFLQLVADNKVKYKHLAGGVEFIPAIPKNASGKILRRILKEQVKEQLQLAKAKL
jgi:acyl-coenzyme A synthetase/AMP-(fatty) acid ligase